MSRKMGADRIIEEVCAAVEARLRFALDPDKPFMGIESPIEKLWFVAYLQYADGDLAYYRSDYKFPVGIVEEPEEGNINLGSQVVIFDDWPIDFVLCAKIDGKVFWAAIECDGHDFHERTKDQARRDRSRDRELQARGFRVFRFTGSEIFKDPMKCAREVYEALVKFETVDAWK